MKYLAITLITFTIILVATAVAFAQPGLPSAPSQAPIDGGLGLLAAAGGVYVIRKLRNRGSE